MIVRFVCIFLCCNYCSCVFVGLFLACGRRLLVVVVFDCSLLLQIRGGNCLWWCWFCGGVGGDCFVCAFVGLVVAGRWQVGTDLLDVFCQHQSPHHIN